jgi:hypothetical protein
VSCLEHFVKL